MSKLETGKLIAELGGIDRAGDGVAKLLERVATAVRGVEDRGGAETLARVLDDASDEIAAAVVSGIPEEHRWARGAPKPKAEEAPYDPKKDAELQRNAAAAAKGKTVTSSKTMHR